MKKLSVLITIYYIALFTNAQTWNWAEGIRDKVVRAIIHYNSDTILAGVDDEGIYISYNSGENWTQFALQGKTVYSLIKIDNAVIAGTYGEDFYKTTCIDSSWKNISLNDYNLVVNSLSIYNETIYACTYGLSGPGAVYSSIDSGNTWDQYGTTPPYAFLDIDFNSSGRAYVATPFGAYYSDNQSAWIKTSGIGTTVRTVTYIDNSLIIYGTDEGTYLSADNGVSGEKANNINGRLVLYINDTLYVSTGYDLRLASNVDGPWESLSFYKDILALLKLDNKFIAGTSEGIYTYSEKITSIKNKNTTPGFYIYPNPASDVLNIGCINTQWFQLELYNLLGHRIITSNSPIVNISELNSGIYIYILKTKNNLYIGKIIKE